MCISRSYDNKFKTFAIILALLLLVFSITLVFYTSSTSFRTKNFAEDDFSLFYAEGITLRPVSQAEVIEAVQNREDLARFSSAKIYYSARPALIGYRIEVQNPETIFVYAGRIYGLKEGRSNIYVYSQDGRYLTTRNIIVKAD